MDPFDTIRRMQGAYVRNKIGSILLKLREVRGDVAEFGTYDGYFCRGVAEIEPDRTIWAFDTFEGMPWEEHDPVLDATDPPGKWKPHKPSTMSRLMERSNIKIVEGRFADTLGSCHAKFALVHIDCDTYAAYTQVLGWLPDHLVHGAIVAMDDVGPCKGATKAAGEFRTIQGGRCVWEDDNMFVWWP